MINPIIQGFFKYVFIGFQPSKVVQDFAGPSTILLSSGNKTWLSGSHPSKKTSQKTGRFSTHPIQVGGWATPLKNMKVNWDDKIPNIWENKKCSKPPTSIYLAHSSEVL